MKITILAFNYGNAGRPANGPGMCLKNFVGILKRKKCKVSIFSTLSSDYPDAEKIKRISRIKEEIDASDVVHHWSGLDKTFAALASYAYRQKKKVMVGPNVIDRVDVKNEKLYLSRAQYHNLLTVNRRLMYRIAKTHNILTEKMSVFMIGPDLRLWSPTGKKENFILWKGNSKQKAKDIGFALKVAEALGREYPFEFIGYPRPYQYEGHIEKAKKAKLYFTTSISETMGLTLLESWACGTPSISHPQVYMFGENYKTGIITNKSVKAYSKAIREIMENDLLYKELSNGCREYILENFNDDIIFDNYIRIVNEG